MIARQRGPEVGRIEIGANAGNRIEDERIGNERIESRALRGKRVAQLGTPRPLRMRPMAAKWSCDTRCGEMPKSPLSERSERSAK